MCPARRTRIPAGAASAAYTACMQGMLTGGLLVAAFIAVAGASLVVLLRLFGISRPGRGEARTGG